MKKIKHSLKKTADDLGLPFGDQKKVYNSRLSQELGLWAESENRGDEFHKAVFRAYFAEGKNIANISVLADLAASVHLSAEEATTVLESGAFKAAVDRDWSLSQEKNIKVLPTLVLNGDRLVGAQPYERLKKFIEKNGGKKKRAPNKASDGQK